MSRPSTSAWHPVGKRSAGARHRAGKCSSGARHPHCHYLSTSAWHLSPASRRRCLAPLAIAFLWLSLAFHGNPSRADETPDDPPPAVGSERQDLAWAKVVDAVLPGLILDVAPWPKEDDPDSSHGLAVLLQPEDDLEGPRHLYRLRGHDDDLRPLATDLPTAADTLLRHGAQLWIGEEGRVQRYRQGSGLTTLLELEGLRLDGLVERGLIGEDDILIPEVGRIRRYTADLQPTDDSLAQTVEARRQSGRLELWSPPIRRLGDDARRLVSDPIRLDAHRLRVSLIDLEAEEEAQRQDSFLRFAGPEDVEQFTFVHIDGRPAVIVATTRGDKLGIFEKLELRIFLLKPDRTRVGRLPRASLETVTRNWFRLEPRIVDFDADGKDDLLLIQPDGMGAGKLLVELHGGRGGGLLQPRSRRSKLEAEGAAWDMSSDFTGDGTVDLLLVSGGELRLHAGIPKHRKRVVETEPVHRLGPTEPVDGSIEVAINVSPEGSDGEAIGFHRRPRLLQLDDDAKPEIVLLASLRGRGILRIVDMP